MRDTVASRRVGTNGVWKVREKNEGRAYCVAASRALANPGRSRAHGQSGMTGTQAKTFGHGLCPHGPQGSKGLAIASRTRCSQAAQPRQGKGTSFLKSPILRRSKQVPMENAIRAGKCARTFLDGEHHGDERPAVLPGAERGQEGMLGRLG